MKYKRLTYFQLWTSLKLVRIRSFSQEKHTCVQHLAISEGSKFLYPIDEHQLKDIIL